MILMDMTQLTIRNKYAEMILAVMERIKTSAEQDDPIVLSNLMLAYAELVRAASGVAET